MQSCYIIAEAGVNHNGDLNLAKTLVQEAKSAGADAVKFQTFKAERLVTPNSRKAAYQLKTTQGGDAQIDMLKKLELGDDEFIELFDYSRRKGMEILSSPFDLESVDFLARLNMKIFKIPSGEITNYPYLEKIAKLGKPVIMSTGMANLNEVSDAFNVLLRHGMDKSEITLLHCNSEYPTPMEDVNLRAMLTLREHFGVAVGFSDHTMGIEVPIAAVGMGAKVIEKHFTLDKKMDGPDHTSSLEPFEMKKMVDSIRNIEKALGSGVKAPTRSEQGNINVIRKSLVAAKAIKVGEVFTPENVTAKRPGGGLSPMLWQEVIGRRATKDFEPNEPIQIQAK